jgi:hypothetical protein
MEEETCNTRGEKQGMHTECWQRLQNIMGRSNWECNVKMDMGNNLFTLLQHYPGEMKVDNSMD